MVESNVIDDVRNAKSWVHDQFPTFDDLFQRLRAVERAYADRSGPYAGVPREHADTVREAIRRASDLPGRELLDETRSTKTP